MIEDVNYAYYALYAGILIVFFLVLKAPKKK
jgi:hypothetical protein